MPHPRKTPSNWAFLIIENRYQCNRADLMKGDPHGRNFYRGPGRAPEPETSIHPIPCMPQGRLFRDRPQKTPKSPPTLAGRLGGAPFKRHPDSMIAANPQTKK